MATRRNSLRLLLGSILLLVLTIGGIAGAGYARLSATATRWGDSLVVGPRFSGDVLLPGSAGKIRVSWEDGAPVLDAPSWKNRGPITVTFVAGLAIYHTPPGTLGGGEPSAR